MLQVQDIHKAFGDFKAVNGTNLSVGEGELVAVIGPNGAGKTTLFNLITGQLKPDQGKITFMNEDISHLPTHKICLKGLARSFQIANILLSGKLFRPAHKMAVTETNNILKSVGLLEKAQYIAGSLSHGDQRMLEIAIALGNEPKMLILDEPTAGMSPEETTTTMDLIKQLAETKGLTILFCEHDMDVVFNVSQSIMVMHHGMSIIQGKPDEVRSDSEVQEAYLGGDYA
jgi:branched-chain amino acid transport system ATP-binding protein